MVEKCQICAWASIVFPLTVPNGVLQSHSKALYLFGLGNRYDNGYNDELKFDEMLKIVE